MKELFLGFVSRAKAIELPATLSPKSGSDLTGIIKTGINLFLWVAGILAVIYLIYGGVLYITAGGDAEKATKGRTALINAIIGVVIILLSLVILNYVIKTVGN